MTNAIIPGIITIPFMFRTNLGIVKVYLLAKKRETIIVISGVMFGISMFIVMISFMKGVNHFLDNAMLSATPDIRISQEGKNNSDTANEARHPDKSLANADNILLDLGKNDLVQATSPVLSSEVLISHGLAQSGAVLDGVDIREETKIFDLSTKMTQGKTADLSESKHSILLGQGLARKLNVRLGDTVNVFIPGGQAMRLRVAGMFQFGMGMVDNIKAIMNIAELQQSLGKTSQYITEIRIKLSDTRTAKKLAAAFEKRYGYKALDWSSSNSSILASNVLRDILTYVVSFALLIVAAFGIYNMLNMTIAAKLKDIAILRTEGFSQKDVLVIFLSQALIIGLIGSMLGLLVGLGLSYVLSLVRFPSSEFISLKYLPVLFEAKYYLRGFFFGVVTTFVAGLFPSLRASRLDPVAILRG